MRMKHAILGLAALAAALACVFGVAASAATGSNTAKPPIHFALVSYAVPGSDSLTELTAGARQAAKQINAKGGFGGRTVVIDACNSMFSPATSTVCVHKLLAKHPVAEFGCELT